MVIVPERAVHSRKMPYMSVTLSGITGAAVREVQPQKVEFMFVTLLGIAGAVVRDVQL